MHPFNTAAETHADMILRSSDGVDFYVMKGILAVSSPIFQDMTSLAKPLTADGKCTSVDVSEEGLPVVVMYESDANILDTLLRILYPVVTPRLDHLSLISGLLCAAQKYEMTVAQRIAEDALRRVAVENGGQRSLEVYVIACEYQLEEILNLSAAEFLKCSTNQAYFTGLEKVSASALFRLYDYRRKVADRVDTLFSPLKSCYLSQPMRCLMREIECSTKSVKPAEGCGSAESGWHISSWWSALREPVRSEIHKAPLSDSVINISSIVEAVCSSNCCPNCREKVFRQLLVLETAIKQEMSRLAAEVRFCNGSCLDMFSKMVSQVSFEIPWA